MDQTTSSIAILVVAAALVALIAWLIARRRRSDELQQRFGTEYGRAVDEHGSTARAETVLGERVKRVERLHIRALTAEENGRFAREWKAVQAEFVDSPPRAVAAADRLVGSLMETRGYPMGEFEQRAADISVDHPAVVEHYRAAHATVTRPGTLGTEDLRSAMLHYRALFDDLLETAPPEETMPERAELRR